MAYVVVVAHEADANLSIICLVFSDVPNTSYTYCDRAH